MKKQTLRTSTTSKSRAKLISKWMNLPLARLHTPRIALLAGALLLVPASGENEEGFKPLFNGKDLTGWRVVNGQADFSVENGEIVGVGKDLRQNSFLRSEQTYKDFDFRFEFKFDNLRGNSGMMFRGMQRGRDGDGRVYGYQCEHCNDKKRAWSGGLFDEQRRKWLVPYRDDRKKPYTDEEKATHAATREAFTAKVQSVFKWDDWNEFRILANGRHIQIWLNGVQTVDFVDEDEQHFTPEGFFGMQVHFGRSCEVRWRNIRIKEL